MRSAHPDRRKYFLLLAALAAGGALGVGLDRAVLAQQSGIKRTILSTTDVPTGAAYKAVMGIAEIAPGATAGKHRHPGFEIGYLLEGSLVLEHEGKPPLTLKPGDSFKNDVPHDAKNPGTIPAKILAVYVVEKGKPMAEPVK